MTWERVEGVIGSDNLARLSKAQVGVVGAGSGGGFVAQALAMSGVGHFVLVDDDTLEEGNIVRHVADSRDIGKPKAEAVASLIKLRNPKAEVKTIVGRIEQNMDALDNLDILVVGVDNENAKYILNEAVLKRDLTAVYAGVYERGEGGDVVVIRPYNGPCYACWAAELREGMTFGGEVEELDYGMIGESGTLEAEPGLWIQVVKIAAIQADLILNELLRGTDASEEMPGNTIIIANNALEIVEGQENEPHTAVWVNVGRDTECLVCGDKARRAANLSDESEEAVSLDDLAGEADIVFEEDENASQQMAGNGG